jgi:hypothetical protein
MVGQVEPTAIGECVAQILPRQRRRTRAWALASGHQVTGGVPRLRRVVVIGAEDEDTGYVEQRTERLEHDRQGTLMGDVVSGVDDKIRFERRQPTHPGDLARLARREMQIRHMQHA